MEKTLEQLATAGRREYYKQYREKNKERLAEYRKNYFAKKAALAAQQSNVEKNDGQAD